jgi:hypothetical protein
MVDALASPALDCLGNDRNHAKNHAENNHALKLRPKERVLVA